MTILQALKDPKLLRPLVPWATFGSWLVLLKAIFALKPTAADRELFTRCTGRTDWPTEPVWEVVLICGRRAGKSLVAAIVAVYLACFQKYEFRPGERGVIMLIAADRKQARVLRRYVGACFELIPLLRRLVTGETADSIALSNGIDLEIHTASYKSVRGYTIVAAIADETAFWETGDSANPDTEIFNALRPALSTVPGSKLILLSSPHARRGELWRLFKRYYGVEGAPTLIWRADTRTMNPLVPQRIIDDALERDESAARAEYLAEFRSDLEAFVSEETIEAVTDTGVTERGAHSAYRYVAFCDPSGGGSDSMTLAIAHTEGERIVLDLIDEVRPPFSPDTVVARFPDRLRPYRVTKVSGDRYAGEWPTDAFKRYGVTYRASEHDKSGIYREALPLLTSERARLLDVPKLRNQLARLERRQTRAGRELIDHGPGGHDDVVNAALGALVLAAKPARSLPIGTANLPDW